MGNAGIMLAFLFNYIKFVMDIKITVSDDHQIEIKVDDLSEDKTPWLEVARILMEAQNVALIQSSYLTAKEKSDERNIIKES